METKNLIIICISVIILVLIAVGVMFIFSNTPIGTSLSIDADSSQYINDTIHIKLVDNESNPLANKTINLNFTKSNKKEYIKSVVTDNKGIAKFKLNLPKGNYNLTASFSEEGYVNSYAIDSFKLKEHEKPKAKKTSSSSSSSSTQYSKYSPQYGTYVNEYTDSNGIQHIDGANGFRESYDPNTGILTHDDGHGHVEATYMG